MSRAINTCLLWGLLALLTAVPLVAGGNRPALWALHASLAGLLAIGSGLAWLFGEKGEAKQAMGLIVWPAGLLALVGIWILMQAQGGLLVHPLWHAVWEGDGISARMTINRHETMLAALRLATAACVFVGAFAVGRDRQQANRVLTGFVIIACGYGLVAMLLQVSGTERPVLLSDPVNGQFSGTFVNRNNAATYFGLGLVVAVGLFFKALPRGGERPRASDGGGHLRRRLAGIIGMCAGRSGLYLSFVAVLATVLLLTGSRGGIAASGVALVMLAGLHVLRDRARGGGGRQSCVARFVTFAILATLVVVLLETAGARFINRLADNGLGSQGRVAVLQTGGAALGDHLAMGAGYGTFADVLPLYRGQGLDGLATWDKAHNDYLELALGLGLPMAMVALLAIALPAWSALRGFFRRRRTPVACGVAVAATGLVGLHGLVDFSLQIQAVTLSFATLLGLGLAQAESRRTGRGMARASRRPHRKHRERRSTIQTAEQS